MGLRVRAAGLKVFMVSIDDLVCQLCIGCSLSLSNNGTKLGVITDIFGLSYSFVLVPTHHRPYPLSTCVFVCLSTVWVTPSIGKKNRDTITHFCHESPLAK